MFMEQIAQHTGMPLSLVPAPALPLPLPPTYSVSASPDPSSPASPLSNAYGGSASPDHEYPENDGDTFDSAIGVENPEETLQRIANGMFGGYVNGCGSGGDNFYLWRTILIITDIL